VEFSEGKGRKGINKDREKKKERKEK